MKNKWINSYLVILFIFIVVLKLIFINNYTNYFKIVLVVFWLISLYVLYKKLGLRHNKTIVNKNAVHIVTITSILYFLFTFILGLFMGFEKNNFLFINSFYSIVMIISQELIRTMVAKKCHKKKYSLIILTILYIILDIILIFNSFAFNNYLSIIIFLFSGCLPIIIRHILSSYISYEIGYMPCIIYRLLNCVLIPFMPIIPSISNISFLIDLAASYIIYNRISKLINNNDSSHVLSINIKKWYVNIPLSLVLFFIIILVSGVFKYRIIAIASGSMEPNIYRGDAVVFEKIDEKTRNTIDENEIIVFIHNGNYITHRVFNKYTVDGKVVYKTKGDSNKEPDNYVVEVEDIVGVIKYKIKYLGFPSIWLQELFAK